MTEVVLPSGSSSSSDVVVGGNGEEGRLDASSRYDSGATRCASLGGRSLGGTSFGGGAGGGDDRSAAARASTGACTSLAGVSGRAVDSDSCATGCSSSSKSDENAVVAGAAGGASMSPLSRSSGAVASAGSWWVGVAAISALRVGEMSRGGGWEGGSIRWR